MPLQTQLSHIFGELYLTLPLARKRPVTGVRKTGSGAYSAAMLHPSQSKAVWLAVTPLQTSIRRAGEDRALCFMPVLMRALSLFQAAWQARLPSQSLGFHSGLEAAGEPLVCSRQPAVGWLPSVCLL